MSAMTHEAMNDFIQAYCPGCDDCLIVDICSSIGGDFLGNYDACKKAYEILIAQKKDSVNHPEHYQGKHECIDEMVALFGVEAVKHFCMCNVYKYRFRAARKNGQEDLEKADWYMDKLIELGGENHDKN